MLIKKPFKTSPVTTAEETSKQVEEAAYYSYLNRGRLEQAGDDLTDWLEAEKAVGISTR